MAVMKILDWRDNRVIWEGEAATMKDAIHAAIAARANLSWANLSRANLSWANLSGANLSGANLSGANLCKCESCKPSRDVVLGFGWDLGPDGLFTKVGAA